MIMDFCALSSKPIEVDSSPLSTAVADGLPVEEEVEEIVRQHPPILSLSATKIRPRSLRAPVRRRMRVDTGGETYKMFQISTIESRRSMDGSDTSSSAVTMVTSATSTCTDPWSSSGTGWVEEEEDEPDYDWGDHEDEGQRNDDLMLVPKLEPVDDIDMADLSDVKESIVPETPETSSSISTPAQVKRPRGRPRKHPKPSPEALAKVAKGRSKTGCITCRRRKKKCDETKPGCLNCEKNSVICEGYPEKTTWKSGKEKGEEGRVIMTCQQRVDELIESKALQRRARSITISSIQLPYLIHGVETEGDRMFLHHYISRLSMIFTLEGENDCAFRNILLPMAQQHSGLMHSILALSSKHIDYSSPYGLHILQEHPNVDVKMLEERSQFHHDEAVKELTCRETGEVTPATYAQMICFVLQTLSDKNPKGQHRFHLQYYQKLIRESPPDEETEFTKFIHEFFQYHICADQLIHLPQGDVHLVSIPDDWNLPTTVLQPSAVRLLGVFDGLFLYMSKITNLRNKIRHNMEHGIDPVVGFGALHAAAEIDAGLREWTPAWPAGDPRDAAGTLYRQMMWIYLWRTMYPPHVTNWKPDPKNLIKKAVDDGLEILSRFGARDPSQTLILAPAFVIGCAAFEQYQREPIRKAIGVVKNYMEYNNTDTALAVLEEVWRLMDEKDERSWDWQAIAHRMGMDFLAT